MRILMAFLVTVFLVGCSQPPEPAGPVRRFPLQGEIVQLDAERQVARIRHGRIDGWMEAMTMDFPVRDPSEFAKLKIGQRIRATVFQRESDMDYWVGAIEVESGQP